MNAKILNQIVQHPHLLPQHMQDQIRTGIAPPLSEIAWHLAVLSIDADLMTEQDPQATWVQRRLSKQIAAAVCLLALAVDYK